MSHISEADRLKRTERLQLFLLNTLDSLPSKEGISDTRKLQLPDKSTPTDALADENERQLAVKAALDSLASKEVRLTGQQSEEGWEEC